MEQEHQEQKKHTKRHVAKEGAPQAVQRFGLWKTLAVVLGILLIASILTSGFGGSGVRGSMSAQKTAEKAIAYLNANILQGQTAILGAVSDAGAVYAMDITVGGRTLTTYASKDGRYFFPNGLDLDGEAPAAPSTPPSAAAPSAPPPPSTPIDMVKLADDDPVKGKANAPVTMIEFSDFQCPFCGRFYKDTLGQIQKEYIDTGKVKLVYRDFPLSFHPFAKPAAIAAECADDQGKFWQYHDKIFDNQGSLSADSLKSWAKDIGLDANKFDDCVSDPKTAAEVDKDMSDGQAAGVQGTPAFFVNGRFISGAQPFANFKAAIDAALIE